MTGGTVQGPTAPWVPAYRLPVGETPHGSHASHKEEVDDWILPLLRRNAIWFCQLRWVVVATLVLIGLGALVPGLFEQLGLSPAPGWALGAATFVAMSNLVFSRLARGAGAAEAASRPVERLLWAQIIADLLVLTAVIYGLGGGLVAPRVMYLFHIILACIVFPPRESLAVVALAALMQLLCLAMISLGVLPSSPPLIVSNSAGPASASTASLVYETGAMFLIWVAIWYLASELVRRLRRRDRQLALANRRLEASLEERTLHMLQTTHQLKAPFAAIHAQTQLLLGGYCGEVPARISSVVERIAGRSQALSRQIQSMLQLANLRSRGQTALPQQECNLAEVLENVLTRVEPSARQRGIRIRRCIRAITVHAAPDHMVMLLENLIVNAITYSYENGVVSVTCLPRGENDVVMSVRDNGIGIPGDKLPHIFEDYFRTDQAVRHNRMSTGLGLAIVRQVANEIGCSIEVKSVSGWGTRFTATLPRQAAGVSPKNME